MQTRSEWFSIAVDSLYGLSALKDEFFRAWTDASTPRGVAMFLAEDYDGQRKVLLTPETQEYLGAFLASNCAEPTPTPERSSAFLVGYDSDRTRVEQALSSAWH
jgi:hypothetical protein